MQYLLVIIQDCCHQKVGGDWLGIDQPNLLLLYTKPSEMKIIDVLKCLGLFINLQEMGEEDV